MAEQEAVATEETTAAETTETQESPEAVTPQAGTEQETAKAGYEPFSIPEGFVMDEAHTSDISAFAKEFGLDQAQAQKMVDKHFDIVSKNNDSVMEAKESTLKEWASEAMADKEFGGSNLSDNMAGARKAMNSFSQPAVDADGKAILHQEGSLKGQQMSEVEVLMNESGWGNHPAMIRVFHRINQAMSEDSFVQGDMKPREQKKTAAQTMYPNMSQ
jgi:hypothetical protein